MGLAPEKHLQVLGESECKFHQVRITKWARFALEWDIVSHHIKQMEFFTLNTINIGRWSLLRELSQNLQN